MSSTLSVGPRTLADAVPGGRVRSVALVVAGAVFVGLAAQVAIPLPFTPVPLTLQTLAVLLTGAALGSWRGLASLALYAVAGAVGVPWFSAGSSGFHASFGYVIGFVLAAFVVGRLAEARADRSPLTTVATMVLGNLVIYAAGVAGLMAMGPMGLGRALALGVVPFLLLDAVKIVIAAGLLPGAWKLLGTRR